MVCPILAALLHGTLAAGVSQTLRRGTRNGITELLQRAPTTVYSAARPSRWARAHILVYTYDDVRKKIKQAAIIMAALCSRCGNYIFALWFLLCIFVLSFPRLIASVVNLVPSEVYHTERCERPPLFAARLPWRNASRGFVNDSWYLLIPLWSS